MAERTLTLQIKMHACMVKHHINYVMTTKIANGSKISSRPIFIYFTIDEKNNVSSTYLCKSLHSATFPKVPFPTILPSSSKHTQIKPGTFSQKWETAYCKTKSTRWANKNHATLLLFISSPIIDRFSKFFHWHTLWKICNYGIIIYPIKLQMHLYTTL